jgi:DNA repair exonuclease SbcCD ATPase subunit
MSIDITKEFQAKRDDEKAMLLIKIAKELQTIGNTLNTKGFAKTLNEKVEEQKKDIKALIDEINNIEELKRISTDLLAKKEVVEREFRKLQEIKQDIEILTAKQVELNKVENNMITLQENVNTIKNQNDVIIQDYLTCANNINTILSNPQNDLERKLKEVIAVVKDNLAKINDRQINDCMEQLSELKTVFDNIDKKINERILEHNRYVTIINNVREEFNKISENLTKVKDAYKTHIQEDKQIYSALTAEGEFKGDDYVKTFFDDIERELTTFESKIMRVINERDGLPIYEIEKRWQNI